jgi:hypothetical protein
MMNLGEIPKRNIYEVPEGYFEQLHTNIQNRIDTPVVNTVHRSIQDQKIWRFTAGLAASLLFLWLVWHYQIQDPSGKDLLAGISETEMIAYLEQNVWLEQTREELLYEYFLQSEDLVVGNIWQDFIDLNEVEIEEDALWQF